MISRQPTQANILITKDQLTTIMMGKKVDKKNIPQFWLNKPIFSSVAVNVTDRRC